MGLGGSRPGRRLGCLAFTWLALVALLCAPAVTDGQTRPGKKKVELTPPSSQPASHSGEPVEIGGWAYRANRSGQPLDGVPWELIVTPAGPDAASWHKGEPDWQSLPMPSSRQVKVLVDRVYIEKDDTKIPVVEIPDVVWKEWMAPDLQDVVGIHFHELVTDDTARILYTLHKVPPDRPDGKPPEPGSYKGRAGVRVEATLLTPLTFALDQTILVRVDQLEKDKAKSRAEHETGHALASQEVLLDVLRGPQNWNVEYCTGRRCRLAYYWKRELIGRSWGGYRGGVAKISTLRTTVALVPPTRWSMLLPIPPERVTQKQLQEFNDSIVHLEAVFARLDKASQDRFHSSHGAYE
ncbi:MAG TPA: hypothetical protein VMV94_21195 [Phycisphaerae bacterium]|nr:hypothetical protein [Phycisphaerae bacterium]